jgi:hypothetical protein
MTTRNQIRNVLSVAAVAVFALGIGQVQAKPIEVPGGGFQMYKPGTNDTVTAIFPGAVFENYASGIGTNLIVKGTGIAEYSDGSTGGVVNLPGWVIVQGNNDLANNGVDDSTGLNAFAAWGGDTRIESAAPLGTVVSGATYTVSVMVNGPVADGPLALYLLAGGVAMTPSSSVEQVPPVSSWQVISRTFDATAVASHVGAPLTIIIGVQDENDLGNRVVFDNVTLEVDKPRHSGTIFSLR